ncbi:MAG: chemotaxis protein CheW [Desulfarculaceae bacterium]|nr:chemotaxis protein CheW [Desulfarculaceae bacterium]
MAEPESTQSFPEAASSAASVPSDARQSFVSFRLDQKLFALPLDRVERALRMVAPVRLPEAPPWIAGVINLHGQALPVLDLGQIFGRLPRQPHPDQRLLVVAQRPRRVALQVDAVESVVKASPGEIVPPTGHLAESRVLAGIFEHGEELVLLLDPERLAPADWRDREDLWAELEEQGARLMPAADE